jgi:broad-specificity NMP kinase
MNAYEKWRNSPKGKAAIERGMNKAQADLDAFRSRRRAAEKLAHNTWVLRSNSRAIENKLNDRIGIHIGRIDDTYTAEVPLTIGWNAHEDGTSLAYVSLGGVDVTEYLPPDVLADIQSHIESCYDDEPGRAA